MLFMARRIIMGVVFGWFWDWEVLMSKREIRILVLIMVGITLLGFIFGRVILPRIIMWSIGSKVELADDPMRWN